VTWLASLGQFAAQESKLDMRVLTVHAYPTKHCGKTDVPPAALFQSAAIQGLAAQVGGWVKTAAAHQLPLRVDEMNSVSCGGQLGLSNSFGPALWALETLPRFVQAGVAGVNFHTIPGSFNALLSATLTRSGWRVGVQPEYLGLLAFAQAAPAGSRLLKVSAPSVSGLDEWATQTAGGTIHVVLVNSSTSSQPASVHVAGVAQGATAAVSRLTAASLAATSGVRLGGQAISPTTGNLAGAPSISTVSQSSGGYQVTVPAGAATILTISSR